ncbi:hypothetical protein ACLI4U_18915 (plasmid) [Natrialbaceae archaeon A-CW2]
MHREVGWMKPADTYILDFMASTDAKLKPASIALNVPYSPNWVGQRCRQLAKRDLLEQFPDDGAYKITEKGKRVVDEEIDPADLEDDD